MQKTKLQGIASAPSMESLENARGTSTPPLGVDLRLVADVAERQGRGDGGDGNGDADHVGS